MEIGIGVNDDVGTSRVYVWDLPYPYHPECQDWPQYHHDAMHTGNYDYQPAAEVPSLSMWAIVLLIAAFTLVLGYLSYARCWILDP